MNYFILKRVWNIAITILIVSFLLFLALEINSETVARYVLGQFSTEEQRAAWLEANGYNRPWFVRYVDWLFSMVTGDFGYSTRYRTDVAEILWPRLGYTALLGAITFGIMTPLAIFVGALAGSREGSRTDHVCLNLAVITTSVPEFASATLFSFILVLWLGVLPGTSGMNDGIDPRQLVLPVLVLVTYTSGYLALLTRTSMAEVMASQYIRTARLKGLMPRTIIIRHGLRNALIAPFTAIVLQINWLLSGVIVVEYTFAYPGFGSLLLEAALNKDLNMIQACAMVSVFVVVGTQIISDIGYMLLNPKIRFT